MQQIRKSITYIRAGKTEQASLNHRPMVGLGPGIHRSESFHSADNSGVDSLGIIGQVVIGLEGLHFDKAGGSFFAVEFGVRFPGTATAGSSGTGALVSDGYAARAEFAIEVVGIYLWGRRKSHCVCCGRSRDWLSGGVVVRG